MCHTRLGDFLHYTINHDFCNIHDGKIPTVKDLSKFYCFFQKNRNFFAKKCVYIGEGAFECRANAILDNFSSLCYTDSKFQRRYRYAHHRCLR